MKAVPLESVDLNQSSTVPLKGMCGTSQTQLLKKKKANKLTTIYIATSNVRYRINLETEFENIN